MDSTSSSGGDEIVVVGSGAGGATVARELARSGRRVRILERGRNRPLHESLPCLARIADEVPIGQGLSSMRAVTGGGSTSIYFALADLPPLDTFRSLGIDLSAALEEVRSEVPIGELDEALLSAQARMLRDAARSLGLAWTKNLMLVDGSRCREGYAYEAKWNAKTYLDEAIAAGASLTERASVTRVLSEGGRVSAVEYRRGRRLHRIRTHRVVLAAGSLATPAILRRSGLDAIGADGFCCNPGFLVFGFGKDIAASDSFTGAMDVELEPGLVIGDANLTRTFFRLLMLGKLQLGRLRSFGSALAVGGVVHDELSGRLTAEGGFEKRLGDAERARLRRGMEAAEEVLRAAGATSTYNAGVDAGNVGGTVVIGRDVDERLETRWRGLHVCDGSVIPPKLRIYPTVTLLCLAKHLADQLGRTHRN